MRSLFLIVFLTLGVTLFNASLFAQTTPSSPTSSNPQPPDSSTSKPASGRTPNLAPPRSDTVNADSLGDEPGQSSSKDTLIDLSPPPDDAQAHPQSSEVLMDAGSGSSSAGEFRYWDPHKAAKDIEVGDYYFKRKNYRAAQDRYREALLYKDNDAIATFRLAECLEKMDQPDDARKEYESYLRILPHGPQAEQARKSIERLKSADSAKAQPAK